MGAEVPGHGGRVCAGGRGGTADGRHRPSTAQAAIAKYDNLGPLVTTLMALSGYPVGPVNEGRIQRVAAAMLQFGLLGQQYAAEVEHGALVESMVGTGS